MKLTQRDKRALILLSAAAVVSLAVRFWPESATGGTVPAELSIPQAQRRLTRLRQTAVAVPGREATLKKVSAELAEREKGLIQAETAAQAQAQMVQVLRRIASAQQPPLQFRSTGLAPPRAINAQYGEVVATVTVECGIEQIVNLLADVGNQPEYIATRDITLNGVNNKQKLVPAVITFTALVPRRLVPDKKEGYPF